MRTAANCFARSVSCFVVCFSMLFLSGCALQSGKNSSSSSPRSGSAVTVTPSTAQIRAGDTQQFSASIAQAAQQASGGNVAVTWSVNGIPGGSATFGMISTTGLYTAPPLLPAPNSIVVTATSVSDASASGTSTVTLDNPIPIVTAVSPATVTVGNFTITVSGSKFAMGAQVLLAGTALSTTFLSTTQLVATGTVTQTQIGNIQVSVRNPDPGSADSASAFSVQVSTSSSIHVAVSPATPTVRAGDAQQFTAAVSGTSNTAVTWSVNGVPGGNGTVGTISASGLYQAPSSLPNPNSVSVGATSVADSTSSDATKVTIDSPIPIITSVSPTTVTVGNFTLTVTGSKFVNGAAVVFGGQLLTTTFVSSTQLTATGKALQQQVGPVQVMVQNPDPGSTDSAALQLQVNAAPLTAMAAARLLEQSTWGPTPQLIAHVQQVGMQAFLNEQFSTPASGYQTPGPKDDLRFVQKQFFVHAMTGQDQLRQRVAFAFSQIMVISARKIGDPSAFTLWMNMMQNDAFGNYSTLLRDVTLSPSMGNYLDMANNDGCNGCSPNENYAREVMQLFSIGLSQLNPDGSVQLDGSGNPVPTYTQDTIIGLAHVFTGWTYPTRPGSTPDFFNPEYYGGPMIPFDSHHDAGSKLLLNGTMLPAGGTATADLNATIQNILNHPNVGPFISKQLIQKLVTSNPSPDYVSRITSVFNNNGSGVRGDLKAVVTAILMDPEARRGDDPTQVQSSDGHLKEPLLLMINLMRAMNTTTDGGDDLQFYSGNMRQEPFNPPTVFNFYPPNYTIPGTKLLGPEFKILNTSTTIQRINFVNDLVYGNVGPNTKTDISSYVASASDVNKLLDAVSAVMLHGQMSDNVHSTLVSTLSAIPDNTRRAQAALYLVGSSSQFQVEH